MTATVTADAKPYDGTTTATLHCSLPSGVFSPDVVTCSATGAFASKNVATPQTVNITNITLGGAQAGNYSLSTTTGTTSANITALHITGSFTASNKPYDGTTSATVLTRSLTGVIGGDAVTLTGGTATYNDKTVANGKTVTLTGASLSGTDAGNYILDSVATTGRQRSTTRRWPTVRR
ncbi:MAG: hypothetical protein AUG74_13435 [Bacteroidetes bacterium 13_1_20CM_4_60_6]|nr:MAG: hypothetical protein AUG74_13435 [Bacteroidetes bacterium 13_1_20CM_4_60_6]